MVHSSDWSDLRTRVRINITQFSYDSAGQTTQAVTPDGIILDMIYDHKGRLESVTDNLNQSIDYFYDAYDNLIQTDTLNSNGDLALTVSQTFDNRNRLASIASPHLGGDSITQRVLDDNSNLTGLTDPNLATSSNQYDAEDRLIENSHRLNGITSYTYDTLNRITQVVAPNGVATGYSYDLLGRRTTEQSPDRGTLTYAYDLANNLTSVTDGRGIAATMTYDELERITTKTYPNTIAGKIEDVTYSYDSCAFGIGYLCSVTDESGIYAYEYDAFGNLTQMVKTELGISYTTAYQYD
ncbi:MAG: RHS repeat protein, partial [Immundisolibacteraceae bacterium]|nr:RHS repeat protein [Immundisolibacteraceae bacterium]